jgi:polyhydroxyalkanoate synthesis regulator phasin
MKAIRFIFIMIVLVMGFTSSVRAGPISERVEMAERRIERGIQSGSLTREEAHRLKREFFQIRREEESARSDGRLDHRERERLHSELDRLERHISHLKHNDSYRGEGGNSYRGEGRDDRRRDSYRREGWDDRRRD